MTIYIDGFGRTEVKLIRDGRSWWCEGVEYDYGAQGDNRAEALWHFKIGFQRTIQLNIERNGFMDWAKWRRLPEVVVQVPGPIVERVRLKA
jgi:hypothetical protein